MSKALQWEEHCYDDSYRYGFNGQEKDNEIAGEGNSNTAMFWQYDTRLARRWNRDPKPNPSISDYACFAGNPILYSDILGDTININGGFFFRIRVKIALAKVSSTETGRQLVNDLMSHPKDFYIKKKTKGKLGTVGSAKISGNIGVDPQLFGRYSIFEGKRKGKLVLWKWLLHEGYHTRDNLNGEIQADRENTYETYDGYDLKASEVCATDCENTVYAEMGKKLRSDYEVDYQGNGRKQILKDGVSLSGIDFTQIEKQKGRTKNSFKALGKIFREVKKYKGRP
ncbi:MAG: M91 family zinc metallopeptidase [Flavobacteriales bacterium]